MSCPYSFFLRYEGGLKTTMTHYLALGNAVHLTLEKMFGSGPRFYPVWNVDEAIKFCLTEFNRMIEEDEIFVSYPQLKKAQADAAEMVARYYAQISRGEITSTPFGVETEFKLPIGNIEIVGKIDKIDKVAEGLIVIDYKTGAKKPDPWFFHRNLQFTAYYWACKELFGEYPIKVGWHHLRTGDVIYETRTEWDVDQLKRTIENVVKMSEQDFRFRSYQEAVCHWCSYSGFGHECDDQKLEAEI